MSEEESMIKIKEIRRRDIFISIPAFSKRELKNFIKRNTRSSSDSDKWILDQIFSIVPCVEGAFQVCLRKPEDLGLTGNSYSRVWDFNKALWGDTLSAWQVVHLCLALKRMKKRQFYLLYEYCEGKLSVMSPCEEAGRHVCALDILFNKSIDSYEILRNLV